MMHSKFDTDNQSETILGKTFKLIIIKINKLTTIHDAL